MHPAINTRLRAFWTHLVLSALALGIILALIVLRWYPGELIHAGATEGLRILIGVDLILGPVLTLIVFNIKKKRLTLDLTIIGIIQIACLFAGLWLLYQERPVAQVLADDGIHLLAKSDLELYKKTLPTNTTGLKPAAYMLQLPENWSEIPAIKMTTEVIEGTPFSLRHDLYSAFSEISNEEFLRRINNITSNLSEENKKLLLMRADSKDKCEWIPVISRHVSGNACVNLGTGIVKLGQHKRLLSFSSK